MIRSLDINYPGDKNLQLSLNHLINQEQQNLSLYEKKKIFDRYLMLKELCQVIEDDLVAGGSLSMAKKRISNVTKFVLFADRLPDPLSHNNSVDIFSKWVFSKLIDVRNGSIKQETLYHQAATVSKILSRIFGVRSTELLRRARISKPKRVPGFTAGDKHKQNLEQMTFPPILTP